MGLFDGSNFKSKDAEALYKSLKQHYQSILAPGDDQKAKQSDVLNNSVFHKTSLRTIKKVLEGIAEDAVLFSLDLHDKPVSAEGLTALLKAASEKNPKSSAHLFPISELILSKGQWTLADRRTSVDRKPASTEEENQNAQAERLFIQTLCDYLRETKTLAKLDLSSNKIGTEAVKTLAGSGIRYNDSLEFLGLANTGFDGSGQVADAFISALLELQDKRKLLPADNPLAHQENYNSSLRRLDLKSGEWKDDALQKFTALAFLTTRVTGLTLVYNEDRLETVRHEGKTLPYLLKRNGSIQGVLDDVMKSVMKRPFRQKLTNFRESVKNHRIKGKGGVDESGPVYKWIAQSEAESRNDPYHPKVTPSGKWKAGYAISVGRRAEMQDVLAMRGKFRERSLPSTGNVTDSKDRVNVMTEDFWAVFDGHGGREAASFAADNLPDLMKKHLDAAGPDANPDKRCEAIKAAFQECQKKMAPWNTITGTTVVGLYIHDNMRYTINLGDSRMIVYNSKNEIAELLTRDHRPNDPEEQKRILSTPGGFIEDGRVNGKSQVTRSLGDSALTPYVSCMPDVSYAPIDADDDFVVLASDGLWDVFQGDEGNVAERHTVTVPSNMARWMAGCKEVSNLVLNSNTASSAAKKLCELAYGRGSTDNISVIVIYLKFKPLKDREREASAASVPNTAALNRGKSDMSLTQNQPGFDKNAPKIANPLFNKVARESSREKIEVAPGAAAAQDPKASTKKANSASQPNLASSLKPDRSAGAKELIEEEGEVSVANPTSRSSRRRSQADGKIGEKSSNSSLAANKQKSQASLAPSQKNEPKMVTNPSGKLIEESVVASNKSLLGLSEQEPVTTPVTILIPPLRTASLHTETKGLLAAHIQNQPQPRESYASVLPRPESGATESLLNFQTTFGKPSQTKDSLDPVSESVADSFLKEMTEVLNNLKI